MKPPAKALLALALRRCRDAEIYWEERSEHDLANPEAPRRAAGWGIRVNHGGTLGFAWGGFDRPLEDLLEEALAAAARSSEEGLLFCHGLPPPPPVPEPPPLDPAPALEGLSALVGHLEFLLPAVAPGSYRLRAGVLLQQVGLLTRAGERVGQRSFYRLALCSRTEAPLCVEMVSGKLPETPAELLCELVWRASLSTRLAEALVGEVPALWTPAATAALLRDLASTRLNAAALRFGAEEPPPPGPWLAPEVTLVDDGTLAGAPGSAGFDAEGQPRRPVPLVERGVVRQILSDRFHARLLGLEAPGLAVRDWARPPRPGYSNLVMGAGTSSMGELADRVGDGVLLDRLVPCSPPAAAGQFRRVAELAYRLRSGRPAERLEPVVVTGSYEELLGPGRVEVGRVRIWNGRCLAPALATSAVRLQPAEGGVSEPPGYWW